MLKVEFALVYISRKSGRLGYEPFDHYPTEEEIEVKLIESKADMVKVEKYYSLKE